MRPKSRIPPSPATRWIWSLISLIPTSASASDTDATSPVSIGIRAGVVALVLLAAAAGRHFARLRRALADQVAHERGARNRLEERLHRSERLVEETHRLGHLGTWEWDAENDRLEWSAEIYRIFAMPAERFPGTYQGSSGPHRCGRARRSRPLQRGQRYPGPSRRRSPPEGGGPTFVPTRSRHGHGRPLRRRRIRRVPAGCTEHIGCSDPCGQDRRALGAALFDRRPCHPLRSECRRRLRRQTRHRPGNPAWTRRCRSVQSEEQRARQRCLPYRRHDQADSPRRRPDGSDRSGRTQRRALSALPATDRALERTHHGSTASIIGPRSPCSEISVFASFSTTSAPASRR